MRAEWRFAIAAAAGLAAGAALAEPYARLAAPYYAAVDRLIAAAHPWTIREVAVMPDPGGHGMVLRLTGEVRRRRGDPQPGALVATRVQVGEAIETPIVFWALLFAWPAVGARERGLRVAVGVPVFAGLEAATTGVQLVHSMAQASALLAGDDSLTLWEHWARFLEAGGDFVLAAAGALATLALTNMLAARRRAD